MKKIILSIFVFALSFSTVSAVTVISGEVGGSGGGGQVVDPGKPVMLDFSVKTDKKTYELGQPVKIKISAKADGPATLKFTSGCQTNYYINDSKGEVIYNFIASALCTMALTERELPAEWDFVHETGNRPLPPGQYQLIVEVIGYGQAMTRFSVSADGVVPELPAEGGVNVGKSITEDEALEIALKITISEGIPAEDYTIVLYEATSEVSAFYEVSAMKSVKILKLFKAEMTIRARVLASDGEVLQVKKPWWAVLVI